MKSLESFGVTLAQADSYIKSLNLESNPTLKATFNKFLSLDQDTFNRLVANLVLQHVTIEDLSLIRYFTSKYVNDYLDNKIRLENNYESVKTNTLNQLKQHGLDSIYLDFNTVLHVGNFIGNSVSFPTEYAIECKILSTALNNYTINNFQTLIVKYYEELHKDVHLKTLYDEFIAYHNSVPLIGFRTADVYSSYGAGNYGGIIYALYNYSPLFLAYNDSPAGYSSSQILNFILTQKYKYLSLSEFNRELEVIIDTVFDNVSSLNGSSDYIGLAASFILSNKTEYHYKNNFKYSYTEYFDKMYFYSKIGSRLFEQFTQYDSALAIAEYNTVLAYFDKAYEFVTNLQDTSKRIIESFRAEGIIQ